MKKKKSKGPFDDLQDAAIGIGGLGITTGATAGIASHAPAGTPSLTGSLNTLAGFSGIATTAVAGKSVLNVVKPKKRKRWY